MKKFLLSILCCLLAVVNVQAEVVTYTVESKSSVSVSGDVPTGATATYSSTYSTMCQLTKGNSMTLTLKGFAGNKITGIKMSMKSNKSGGAGSFSAKVGETTISSISDAKFNTTNWYGEWSTSYIDVTPAMSLPYKVIETNEDVVIKIEATANSLYCQSFTITYEYVPSGDTPEVAKPTIEGETTFKESTSVNVNVPEGTTVHYTLDGSRPTEESTEYTGTLTIKADAILKVIAFDEDGNASSLVSQEFTQDLSNSTGSSKTITLVEDVADLSAGNQVVIVASESDVALSNVQNPNNRGQAGITKNGNNVELSPNVQILTLEAGTVAGTFAFYTGSGYLYAASNSNNYLKTQSTNNENGSWSIAIADGVATIKAKGTNSRNWLRYNNSSDLFSCYGSGQQDVSLYKINYNPYVLNVSEAGWATLFLDYTAEIPEGVTCYVISEFGEETIQLAEVTDEIPAKTAVIVEAAAGAYTFDVADAAVDVESVMTGTTKNEYITEDAYVLSMVDGVVGLYQANKAGGVFLNNANKAYLPASAVPETVQGANGFKFRFETTGVEGVQVAEGAKAIFDLSGRKVNDMKAPGLYIVNGKKVLVK